MFFMKSDPTFWTIFSKLFFYDSEYTFTISCCYFCCCSEVMEDIPCIIHPMKHFFMEGEKLTGCGVIEVNFSTPTGLQVWYTNVLYLLKILICNIFVLGWINIDKTNNLENLEIKRIVKRQFYLFILN